tara:strand:+ start:1763 stop:4150 length:2388 start_codon:yes stop_codon:yes gene_type:complete
MKFTISWLKEHLETTAANEEIVAKLTALGLEVEEYTDTSKIFSDFVVGQVLEEGKHPNADKLKVCKVDIGTAKVDVVCGAPNVEKGMKVVYAPPGSTIPVNQMKLKAAKIRGVESSGMMCSEYELGISDNHEGIIRLKDDSKIGQPYSEIAGMDDVVIEIGITPNRQDCLGVFGIARDLAASGLGKLKTRKNNGQKGSIKSPINIETKDADLCPVFAGRYFKGVKNVKSPDWLQQKLKAVGLRPISALVDITNFVMLDLNRPLHVYDADKIDGKIIVRESKKGESFNALDEKSYDLKEGMCAIADEKKVLGLGGIMGGESSGCNESTKNVLLESALFNPINIAKSGRNLSILSDARYRFERGVDPKSVLIGIDRATELISEICGGEFSEVVIAGEIPEDDRSVDLSVERIQKRLGVSLGDKETISILNSLGIETKQKGEDISCKIPSWRQDILEEADLSEEIIRIKGYDHIPTANVRTSEKVNSVILSKEQKLVSKAKHFIAAQGYNELVTWSFSFSENCQFFGDNSKLKIVNPISEDLDILRPSLLPNLIGAVKKNASRGFETFSIFEVGSQYKTSEPEDQMNIACGIKAGIRQKKDWQNEKSLFDVYDSKRDLFNLIDHLIPRQKKITIIDKAPDWYHPGRSATAMLNQTTKIGYFGEIHPRICQHFKIKERINAFELFLDDIPSITKKTTNKSILNLSDFQSVSRDFAFVLDQNIKGYDLIESAMKVDKNLIRDVEIFDLFEDPNLGNNKKSIAIKVTMQAPDRTLKEDEIQELSSKIIEVIEKSTSGSVRS